MIANKCLNNNVVYFCDLHLRYISLATQQSWCYVPGELPGSKFVPELDLQSRVDIGLWTKFIFHTMPLHSTHCEYFF